MANITKIYDLKLQGEKELVTKMTAVNKQFDDAKKRFKELKQIISAGGLSAGEIEKYKVEMQLAKIETEKLRQETIRLNNEGKALTITNRSQREEEKKKRQESNLTLDAYQKMSRQLNEMRKEAKALGIEFGEDSEQFRKAALEANRLDIQLKRIDASLGQFQRNVGNYPKEINISGVSSGVLNQLKNAGIDDILGNQINNTKGKVIQLNSEFKELKGKIYQARESGVKDLNALEREIIQNRMAAENLNKEIIEQQNHLSGLGSVGSGVFSKMGNDLKTMILGYVGLQAAMGGVQSLIRDTKELSDQTTNLEIELEKTAGGADALVNNLSKLDTRTKLTQLTDIANIATKAGTAEENLLGVTEAIDKVKVSFGKDFGDVETGTETFAKLINIFYDDREITGDRILKIGNSIRTLANETVASVPFINDFNGRMAGLRQVFTNFELSDSIGLGAGFEEFKQSAEVSSTALVKILPKLAADTEKFAKILGIPQAEFKKLINQNPAEALIQVSEKLVKSGKGVEEIAASFADAELGAGRVTTILGTLGGKADVFRERIKRAGETINDTANINEAFAKKNENLAGVLDKISKKFSDAANNKKFIQFISLTGSAVLGLITIITSIPFGWWIAMLTLVTLANWSSVTALLANTAATWAKITAKTQEILLTTIGNALIVTATILEYGLAAATGVLTAAKWLLVAAMNAVSLSSVGLRNAWLFLNSTFLATPIGWVVIGLLAIGAATSAYAQKVDSTSLSLKKQGEQLKLTAAQLRVNAEIDKKANEAISERLAKIKILTKVASDLTANDVSRKKALEELIEVDVRYKDALDGNIIRTDKLNQITKELTASIKEQAKAEAAKALLVEKQKQLLDNESEIGRLGVRAEKQKSEGFFKLTGRDRGLFEEAASDKITDLQKQNELLKQDINVLADKVGQNFVKDQNNNTDYTGGDETKEGDGTAKEVKDYLRDINALREAELSELKKAKLEGSITEEEFLKKSLAVNILYNDKILNHFKGTDATTRKLRADTASDTIDKKIETNEKLFKLQEEELKQTLENQKAIAEAKLDDVNSDPYASNLDKAKAEEEYFSTLLNLQLDFNIKMDALEKQFSLKSKKNAEDRKNLILKEQSDLNKKRYALSKAQFDSLIVGTKDFEEYRKNSIAIEASKRRMLILNDKSLNQEQKQREIEKVNSAEKLANINTELGAVNAQIKFYEDRRAVQKLTNDELQKYNNLLKTKQLLEENKGVGEQELKIKGIVELELPSAQSLQKKIQSLFSDANGNFIIGTDSSGNGVDGSALLGQAIAQSFDLASQAMNSYFEGEKQAVERSKKLAYERIDIEKNQLLARAQSEDEKRSIEKQAAEKKIKADKEAGEKLKKIKKAEATVAFATQLAWIGVAAAQNPLNGITLGAAGIAMYATLAAIATAGYLLNMSNISKQQFGKGGQYGFGGKLSGPSHSQNNGMPVINPDTGEVQAYMEGEEGIINKRSMNDGSSYTVSGTPSQIASRINSIGGGVDWDGGGTLSRFMNGGSYLGSKVQPPVFRSYFESRSGNQNNNQSQDISGLHDSIIELGNIVLAESRKKIILNPNDVEDYQREKNKQSEIGTL